MAFATVAIDSKYGAKTVLLHVCYPWKSFYFSPSATFKQQRTLRHSHFLYVEDSHGSVSEKGFEKAGFNELRLS